MKRHEQVVLQITLTGYGTDEFPEDETVAEALVSRIACAIEDEAQAGLEDGLKITGFSLTKPQSGTNRPKRDGRDGQQGGTMQAQATWMVLGTEPDGVERDLLERFQTEREAENFGADWCEGFDGREYEVKLCVPEKVAHRVGAEVHTDDRCVEAWFDCTEYFEQASDKALVALAECGWGGDYPADDVARFFEGKNPEVSRVFRHLENIRDLRSHKDKGGFECHVDDTEAIAWIHANRPHLIRIQE